MHDTLCTYFERRSALNDICDTVRDVLIAAVIVLLLNPYAITAWLIRRMIRARYPALFKGNDLNIPLTDDTP